ncbi:MAG: DUF748 domain-containing protein [Planctomycetota bacterium]
MRPRHRRRLRILLVVLAVLAILLIGARIALPFVLTDRINERLADAGDYTGSIEDVDLWLVLGTATVHGLHVERAADADRHKRTAIVCPRIHADWRWWDVFQGELVGTLRIVEPSVEMIDTAVEDREPDRADGGITLVLPDVIPFTITEATVERGRIRFVTRDTEPTVDLQATGIEARLTGLTNQPDPEAVELPARFQVEAIGPGDSAMQADVRFDPLAELVHADLNASFEGVDLTQLNDLLRAYAELDVNEGRAHLFTEISVALGSYDGYVKVLIRNLDVFSWKGDIGEGLTGLLWEAVAGGLAELLENQEKDQQAARIPIRGDLGGADADISAAIGSILTNAFVRALMPGVENTFTYQEDPSIARTP